MPQAPSTSVPPRRVIVQAALCAICLALAVLTAFVPDWIERLFDMPPEAAADGGSGELEWGIVLLFATGAVVSGWRARREWLRWGAASR